MRLLLSLLLLTLAPLMAAQDLPGPGEGAYTWSTLGSEPADAADLLFNDAGDLLAFNDDLRQFDFDTGTWTATDLPNPPTGPRSALALRGDTLIAGIFLSRSTDGGESWTRICIDENRVRLCDFLSDDFSHSIHEIATGPYAGRLLAGGRLYSDDRGASWTTGTVADAEDFAMHDFAPLPSGRIVATGDWGVGASDDGGETWVATSLFSEFGVLGRAIAAFATPGSVQAHEAGGPEPSCGLADTTLCEGAVMVGNHGAEHARAWWTNDGGRTWTTGALLPQEYDGVAWSTVGFLGELDRSGTGPDGSGGAGRGLTVTGRGYVYATVDGGVTWQPAARYPIAEPHVSGKSVRSAEVGPDGRLYVGEFYNGPQQGWIWVTEEPAAAAFAYVTAGETHVPAEAPDLGVRVIPNPSSSGAVRVEVSVAKAAEVRAYVVDALGRRVADVLAGPMSGARAVEVDIATWAAGGYAVVVEAGAVRVVEAFTVVR